MSGAIPPIWGRTNLGRHIARATKLFYGGTYYLRVLSMELASCHPSVASKFEVASTFLEDFRAAAQIPPVTSLRAHRVFKHGDNIKKRELYLL